MTKSRNILSPAHRWTDSETDLLKRDYADEPTIKIAQALGVDLHVVYGKAKKLGLRKSAAYLSSPEAHRLRSGNTAGASTRFKTGQTPWNKDRRGINYPGQVATQFKAGERRGRALDLYQPVGHERISKDGYLERKINDDFPLQKRWRAVHLVLWEYANGPLPGSHALVFKDGDKRNISLANLELVTRAELMRRNSVHNHGPEIAQLVQLRSAVNRMINKRERASCPTT